MDIYAPTNVCVKDIGSWAKIQSAVFLLMGVYGISKLPNFIEMTSNMIYVVALGGGFKCPRKIHLNTQCPPPHCVLKWVLHGHFLGIKMPK